MSTHKFFIHPEATGASVPLVPFGSPLPNYTSLPQYVFPFSCLTVTRVLVSWSPCRVGRVSTPYTPGLSLPLTDSLVSVTLRMGCPGY